MLGLSDSVWDRLVSLPLAAVPSELPGLATCISAWGRLEDAVTAALAALHAAVQRIEDGGAPIAMCGEGAEAEADDENVFMHPRVAIQVCRAFSF